MKNTICGTGHRPQHVQNFGTAKDDIKKFISENNVDKVISGMALGFDIILAEAVLELKEQGANIILEAAVPCREQDKLWRKEDKEKYQYILSKCDIVTILQQEYTIDCLNKRNQYMVDNSDIVLAYWNGKQNGGTYNCIKYAESKHKKIINIYKEEKNMLTYKNENLFKNITPVEGAKVLYVQCISADLAMGAGIALEFNKYFNTKNVLKKYMDVNKICIGDITSYKHTNNIGVVCLITKQKYSDKPTYDSISKCLNGIKVIIETKKETNYIIRMPFIGCGLDKLNWDNVSQIINDIFKDTTNCSIEVYTNNNNKEEKTMKNKPLPTQEAPILVRGATHFYNLAINPETRNLENKFLITKSSFRTIADVMSVHDNIKNSKERINLVTQDGILDAKARLLSIEGMCKYYINTPVTATTSKQVIKFAKLGARTIKFYPKNNIRYTDYLIIKDAIVSYKVDVEGIDENKMNNAVKYMMKGVILPTNPNTEKQVLSKNFINMLKNIRNINCYQIKQEFTKCVTFEEAMGEYVSPSNTFYSTITEKKEGDKIVLGADAYKTIKYTDYVPKDPTYVLNIKCNKEFEKEITEEVKSPKFLKKIKGLKVQVNGGEVFTFKKKERPVQEDTGYEILCSTSEMLDVIADYYNLEGFVYLDEIYKRIRKESPVLGGKIKYAKLDNNKILAMLDYISVLEDIDNYVNVEKLRSAYLDLLEDEEYDRDTIVYFGNEIYFEGEVCEYLDDGDEEEDEEEYDEDEYEEDDEEDDEE